MQKKFWVDKRIIITGSNGFVGSHLMAHLKSSGANVIGVSRKKTKQSVAINIVNRKALDKFFNRFKPEYCFHLAAIATVEAGTDKPARTFEENILGALNILELSRIYKLKRLIVASTAHVYGDGADLFKEEDPPRPSRPYETSKTCVDLLAQSYADTYHLPVLIPRFVNIYGPGDTNVHRVIPKTIASIMNGIKPTMWGGNAKREYLYIQDAIRAYDLLGRLTDGKVGKNRIYNFGSRDSISVRELINRIIDISMSSLKIEKIPNARPDEILNQRVSWAKAKRILDWEPQVKLKNGLEKTIDWWRTYDKTH